MKRVYALSMALVFGLTAFVMAAPVLPDNTVYVVGIDGMT